MKPKWIICLGLLFFSCTKEDLERVEALKVNPPGWIQGNWNIKDNSSGNRGWKFTPDTASQIDEAGNVADILTGYYVLTGFIGEEVDLEEFESPNFYSIQISTETSAKRYDFSRLSDQEIRWDNPTPLDQHEIYVKAD